MAVSADTMMTYAQSWVEVEEKLQMDIAIWQSETAPESRRKEYRELVEGAFLKFVDRGVATISIGKLEWKLTPPLVYEGYCEKQDDWLLVSGSGFSVALCSPHGHDRELQVCPCSEDMAIDKLGVDDKINDMLTRFFISEEMGTSVSPTLRKTLSRTMSQKKRVEIIEKNFGPPFVRCISDLQNARGVSDVLDAILGFSAAYVSNQQVLQQVAEEPDVEDSYFYDKELMEEERLFHSRRDSGYLWVRQQVRDAARKCQVASQANSEVVKLGAELLHDNMHALRGYLSEARHHRTPIEVRDASHIFQRDNEVETHNPVVVDKFDNLEKNELIELDPNSSPGLHLGEERVEELVSGAASSSGLNESGDMQNNNYPLSVYLRTPSFGSDWQSDMGNDTFSESSWGLVQTYDLTNDVEGEDDVIGAGISDAESLNMMLRDRDPCGSRDCSSVISEFLSLNLSSAISTVQEQIVDEQETPRSNVLKRLASFSSSNSGWSDLDDIHKFSSAPPPSKIQKAIKKAQLETLVEEPEPCDVEIASLCLPFVREAAVKGDVLQWCSCKFNKSRSSIELKFQVGSFMEDDIATLSTGIRHDSLLHIEVFLDATDMHQSLLKGNVRIAAYQGTPGVSIDGTPPVIGLSCYIPHLVRHYLEHHKDEHSSSGYEFPDGELLTGLMKYIVRKLVFLKGSCCVCDYEAFSDPIASIIPKPCDQNLCKALHEAWLVVAPRLELEKLTVECWLTTKFKEGDVLDEERMLQYTNKKEKSEIRDSSYSIKLLKVMEWLQTVTVRKSWARMVTDTMMKTDEFNFRRRLLSLAGKIESRNLAEKTIRHKEFRKSSRFRREAERRLLVQSGTDLHLYKAGAPF